MSAPIWRCARACVAGSAHLAQGRPCEDASAVVLLGGMFIAAVADGAGSVSRAREGAQCAVNAATAHLTLRLQDALPDSEAACADLLREAMQSACEALQQLAGHDPPDELATTLLLTLVTDRWAGTLQVGDGAVVYRLDSGELQLVTRDGQGEFFGETYFLTSPEHVAQAHVSVVPAMHVTGVALCTDAIEHLSIMRMPRSPHAPFFAKAFGFPDGPNEALESYLSSERVTELTPDDKTLVVMVRAP
jgi:hypothetical protein